jgi:hypothetical protein
MLSGGLFHTCIELPVINPFRKGPRAVHLPNPTVQRKAEKALPSLLET